MYNIFYSYSIKKYTKFTELDKNSRQKLIEKAKDSHECFEQFLLVVYVTPMSFYESVCNSYLAIIKL